MLKKAGLFLLIMGVVLYSGCSKKASSQAAGDSLPESDYRPIVDGTLTPGEYPLLLNLNKIKVYLARSRDRLFFGVQSDYIGWIAIGFNSRVMNQARMIIGYAAEGRSEVKEQLGRGNRHGDVDTTFLLASALTESDGQTFFSRDSGCCPADHGRSGSIGTDCRLLR